MTELIAQEEILFKTKSKTLTVTNQRAVYHLDTGQHAQITIIMLEDICSCSVSRNNPWILLLIGAVLGIVGIAGGVFESSMEFASGGVIIAVVFLIIYWAARRATLSLASAAASIHISIAGMKAEQVAAFVSTVARAKDARFKMRHAAAASPNI